jgi:hypothetical protein
MRNALPLRSICSFIYPFNEGHECLVSKSDNTYNTYPPHVCLCGFYGDPVKACSCSAMVIARYQKKISGTRIDRIDIHVEVPRVDTEASTGPFFPRSIPMPTVQLLLVRLTRIERGHGRL